MGQWVLEIWFFPKPLIVYWRDNIHRFLQTKHCFLSFFVEHFAHSLNQPTPQQKKTPCLFNRKLLAFLLKIIGPSLWIQTTGTSGPGDSSRWPSTRWSMTIIGSSLWGGGESCCGWWMLVMLVVGDSVQHCQLVDVVLLLIYVFLNKNHESPGTHGNNMIRHVFFGSDMFCWLIRKPWAFDSVGRVDTKKHLAIAIFEDMFQRFWDASMMLPYPSLKTQWPGLGGTFHCRWSWICIWAIPKHSMHNAFYLESRPAWLQSMQKYANINN